MFKLIALIFALLAVIVSAGRIGGVNRRCRVVNGKPIGPGLGKEDCESIPEFCGYEWVGRCFPNDNRGGCQKLTNCANAQCQATCNGHMRKNGNLAGKYCIWAEGKCEKFEEAAP